LAEIMIVEDHALSRQVLTNLFTSLGHRVLEATDGTAALSLVQANHPDLIISDILLPTIDGIEFARQLRSLPGKEDTPIIFYSATCRLQGELSLGQKCGTCQVIPKPSDPQYILATVNDLLAKNGKEVSPKVMHTSSPYDSPFGASSLTAGLQLATLADLSFSLISQRNPEQLLSCASRAAGEFLNCNSLLTICLDDGGKRYYWGRSENCNCESSLSVPEAIGEQVMRDLAPVSWGPIAGSWGYGLAVPFTTSGCAYGWHCVWDEDKTAAYTDKDRELIMTLSAYSALAYENILLFGALNKNEKHLEELVEERTAKLKETRTELLNVQRLESLGILAGGIAHNFNNALTAILGHIQVAKIMSTYEEGVVRNLKLAEDACFEAQDLTKKLLTFAKGGRPAKKVTALGPLLRDTVLFVLEDSAVMAKFQIALGLAAVEIDQGQIKQVIANLILNAQQAMTEGGAILIEAGNVEIDEDSSLLLPQGAYVRFSVTDTGVGIAPENLNNIFDPFFTTKELGNGLGLATAFSIVKNHGGVIAVESQKGTGATFNVYLPASKAGSLPEEAERTVQPTDGYILIIEDNRIIAQTLSELLEMHGYRVDWAKDGLEGLKLYQKSIDNYKFDAVIMDLVIPGGMGGKEAIGQLRKLDPTVKAVVISGYSNDPVMANWQEYGFDAAFPKPFKINELIQSLQNLINGK